MNVEQIDVALEQINLAWDEVPKETGAIPEQDALYEKVMQCHLGLLKDQPALQNEIDWLNRQLSSSTNRSHDRQRGLWCWRVASIYELAQQTQNAFNCTVQSTELESMRPLFWRTRAQLEDRLGKTESAITSYKHLSEIDPRKRSEYLLNVADCLVKRGRAAEALQITQSVVDLNTASSQVVLRVFDLALAAQQREAALKILKQRMQYKPDDVEVLQRLIDYLESNLNIQQAAQYGWQL
ncbi:MAG: hypothetical protein IT423_11350, partial [Pirellulaceae bacterium]|nr:hypothetical protein [Pirellulaceae bacterium]